MDGNGDPHGDYSPCGDGDGKKALPVSSSGDGGGEFLSRGRGGDGESTPDGEFPVAIPRFV
jgi:hypothetical protein